jgi:hypothetical protein
MSGRSNELLDFRIEIIEKDVPSHPGRKGNIRPAEIVTLFSLYGSANSNASRAMNLHATRWICRLRAILAGGIKEAPARAIGEGPGPQTTPGH